MKPEWLELDWERWEHGSKETTEKAGIFSAKMIIWIRLVAVDVEKSIQGSKTQSRIAHANTQ